MIVIYFGIFAIFHLFASSPPRFEYLAEIKCKITNSRNPQWPKFKNGRTLPLGYFDVTSAVDTDGEHGHYMLAIGANYQALSESVRVIEDIKIVASNGRYTPCPFGYWRSCGWDVDSGVGTDGERGHYDISLCVLTTMTCGSRRHEFVNGIVLKASSSSRAPTTPEGYKRIGWWDVAGESYSNYDGSLGHYMMGMYVRKKQLN